MRELVTQRPERASGTPPDEPGAGPRADFGVVCAEYSPELQLEVLGVRPEDLSAPVLDLGCGSAAALVHHLRRHGLEPVVGVDLALAQQPGLVRGSWFDVDLAPATFGTVISHQAFALHFLNAHLRSASRARRFASRYMELLDALAPGGRFLYAPGLPFVEEHLTQERFHVSTRPVALAAPLPRALRAVFGAGGIHATWVERLA